MKIKLLYIGREKKNFFSDQEALYLTRIKHYLQIELVAIAPLKSIKSLSVAEIQNKEQALFEKHLDKSNMTILLDENGRQYDSTSFSKLLESRMASGIKELNFIIGGAYGFSDNMKEKYKQLISLSKLTFAHHLARVIFLEQIYRALTIMNNEPYHNS